MQDANNNQTSSLPLAPSINQDDKSATELASNLFKGMNPEDPGPPVLSSDFVNCSNFPEAGLGSTSMASLETSDNQTNTPTSVSKKEQSGDGPQTEDSACEDDQVIELFKSLLASGPHDGLQAQDTTPGIQAFLRVIQQHLYAVQAAVTEVFTRDVVTTLSKPANRDEDDHFAAAFKHTFRRQLLIWMAEQQSRKYDNGGDINDLNQAIALYEQCIAGPSPHSSAESDILSNLGACLTERFERLGNLEDIDNAVDCLSHLARMTSDSDENLTARLANLGAAYNSRFQRLGRLEDNEQAIQCLRHAVSIAQKNDKGLPGCLNNLGNAYLTLYRTTGRMNAIDEALSVLEQAVICTPVGHADLASRLNNLGNVYLTRFERLGYMSDLHKAIELQSHGVKLTRITHRNLPGQLNNLGNAHMSRFKHSGRLEDIEHAIECLTQAVLQTPPRHPDMPSQLNSLGNAHMSRFKHSGRLEDVEHAIDCLTQAVVQTPPRHPDMPGRLNNLGNAHMSRFEHLGGLEDVEHAIECLTQAVVQTPPRHPDMPSRLNNLGNAYIRRFQHLGDIQDADRAIEHLASATQLQTGHPNQCGTLANLGNAYSNRFRRLRHIEDLNQAIKCKAQAVELAPSNHASLPSLLSSLGASLQQRFDRTGCTQDLDNAIIRHHEAVSLASESHVRYAAYLNNLGNAYLSRFEAHHQQEDIKNAVDHFKKATLCTQKDHVDLPGRLANLSNALSQEFEAFEDSTVLEQAIEAQTQAVSLVPVGHVDYPRFHSQLAHLHITRMKHSSDPLDVATAAAHLQAAAKSKVGHPCDRFAAAREAALLSSALSLSDTIDAFQLAIDMIPQLIWVGATVDDRYRDLPLLGDLTQQAAVAAIDAGNHSLALEWLEQGRSIVWGQTLQLQTPLGELFSRHPKLAQELEKTAAELSRASSDPVPRILDELTTGNPQSHQQDLRGHHIRSTAAKYERLLSGVRSIPGLERFMLPRKVTELLQAASHHPIVVVNLYESRCDALALISGSSNIQHIPLPNMTYDKAKSARIRIRYSLNGRGLEERYSIRGAKPLGKQDYFPKVLATLWTDLVQPVLQALGYMPRRSEDLPHLTWCITGLLSFLPIHAAGHYDRPMEKLSDYAITSYTPTLAALLPSSRTCTTSSPSLLTVGQAATPNMSPLPGTTTELSKIKERIPSGISCKQLDGKSAEVSSVLDAMKSYSCVHLACHAHQNLTHPTESGFYLHDGTLTLRDIMQQSFKHKHLAFLSACQTAKGDDGLPDEAVHLASGMLMAGYPSVIATMWSIADVHAPTIADEVYARLMKEGSIGPGDTARALHYAVAKLREKLRPKDFVLWMPYIHIGI
ncbi:TPR-like protein, partial [Rhizoctonia solani]